VLAQTETGEFTVGDIKIEGLQRISEGTVFNYLPVNIGDRMTSAASRSRSRCTPPDSSAT
jgi:outer membrane protein assembly factor BamA